MQIDRQVDRQTDKKFSDLSVRSPAECAAYALECARAVRAMGLSLRAQTGHALCMLAQAEHLNLSAQHHSHRDRYRTHANVSSAFAQRMHQPPTQAQECARSEDTLHITQAHAHAHAYAHPPGEDGLSVTMA